MPNPIPLPLRAAVPLGLAAVCTALGLACSSAGLNPPNRHARPADDVRAFFRNPAFARPALSPDGSRIAGLATLDDLPVLVEKELPDGELQLLKKVTEHGMDVRTVGWAGDSLIVVGFDRPSRTLVDKTRRSRMLSLRLLRYRWRDGESWVHPVLPGFADPVLDWLPDDPEHILMHWWDAQGGASVERVTVRSGVRNTQIPAHEHLHTYFADVRGEVRVALGRPAEGGAERVFALRDGESDFRPLPSRGPEASGEYEFAGYAPDPDRIYVRAYAENGYKALYSFDLEGQELGRQLYAHPGYDVGTTLVSPRDGHLVAVEVDAERPELIFFDEEAQRQQAAIDAAFPDTRNRLQRDTTGRRMLLHVSGAAQPPEVYLYDRESRSATFLFSGFPDLDPDSLPGMEAVDYPARDGARIPAYLTLPAGSSGSGLPVVVIVHDGPSQRVSWGWDATVQFLASRGFAVLQPNYRGSSGYGHAHLEAGRGEWGGRMQEDVIDGVRWLVEQGIADPSRVGIYGRGFGGYSALLCAVQEPELFRAVASLGAVTDLVDLREHPDHFRTRDANLPLFGNLPRHARQLAEISPARRAEGIRAPVFVAHGLEDPVVHPRQAELLIDAMEAAGARFEQALYRGEPGHFVDEGDRIDFHHRLASFFETHLAAREPL